jgi:Type II secretion system (T2SS), protein E, N-terminal domain
MKKKLGEILVAAGAVTPGDIDAALSDQSAGEPARLGDLLVSLGKITPEQLAQALSQQYGVQFAHVPAVAAEVLGEVPADLQRRFRFLPIKVAPGSISIAMADLSHASSDVLPVLKKRWATVHLFVAPADEIDAAHAEHAARAAGHPSALIPAVAPAPTGHRKPVVTASDDELFAALDLALPSGPPAHAEAADDAEAPVVLGGLDPLPSSGAAPESFELDVLDPSPAPHPAHLEDEASFFFEAGHAALLTTTPGTGGPGAAEPRGSSPGSGLDPQGAPFAAPPVERSRRAVDSGLFSSAEEPEPLGAELVDDGAGAGGAPLEVEVPITESGLIAAVAAPAPVVPEDVPFFETAPQAVPIASLADDAFVADVPISSGSSLAQLIIQPAPPLISVVPPVDLPRPPPPLPPAPPSPRSRSRPPSPPPASQAGAGVWTGGPTPIPSPEPVPPRDSPAPEAELPDWLRASAGGRAADTSWTGALDELAPSKLITAVTKALIRRGVLSEQDVLDAVTPRKK